MRERQTLPLLWLLTDARNDAGLERAIGALPPGSGIVFRHYHVEGGKRRRRFDAIRAAAASAMHTVVIAGDAGLARDWGADGVYGRPEAIGDGNGLRLATAHDGEELSHATAAGADGIFLSPVFPTRSHPAAKTLGIHGFHVLAQQSPVPIIALGGMTKSRARELGWPRWGAIDGLASPQDS